MTTRYHAQCYAADDARIYAGNYAGGCGRKLARWIIFGMVGIGMVGISMGMMVALTQSEAQAGAQSEAQAGAQSEAQAGVQSEAQAGAQSEAQSEAQAGVQFAGVSHEQARQAVESQEILSLGEILSRVPEIRQSKVLSVVLVDGADGLYGWVYDISLLQEERKVLRLRIDAGTGSVLARGVGGSRQE